MLVVCREFNVDTGNPTMLCIAFNFDKTNSFKSITLFLSITDIEVATKSFEFVTLTDMYYNVDNVVLFVFLV